MQNYKLTTLNYLLKRYVASKIPQRHGDPLMLNDDRLAKEDPPETCCLRREL